MHTSVHPVVQLAVLCTSLCVSLVLIAGGARAQTVPDSTRTTPDSLTTAVAVEDSVAAILNPFTDEPYAIGTLLDSIPPAEGYYLDPTAALTYVPGAFSYTLGNLGWPHQWSYLGMPPSAIELAIDGITVRDPATDRALFDVVPIDMIEPPRESALAHGGPVMLNSRLRPLTKLHPYTELRYEKGGAGLQSISVMHVQQRNWQILGAPTVTQFVARFGFHEWTGQYPNSASDLSQAYGRVGFTSRRWRIRFTDSYTMRTRGAHSGVLQKSGQGFDSVYDQFDARVGDPSAEQRLQRNQFDVSIEHTWEGDLKPLAVWSSYTTFLYRYAESGLPSEESEAESDAKSETRSSEFRLKVEQASPEFVRGHEFTGRFSIEMVDISSDSLLAGGGGSTRSRMIVTADDQFALGRMTARAIIGVHTIDEWIYPSAGLVVRRPFERFEISAEASLNGRAPSPLEESGGRGVSISPQALTQSKAQSVRIGFDAPGGTFGLNVAGFLSRLEDPIEIVRVGEDSYLVEQSPASITWTGISTVLSWRIRSRSGFYGSISPTIQAATVSTRDDLTDGLVSSLPRFLGAGRFGYRNQFFLGDLDADLYVVGRFWSEFRSRVYDPVQALLVLPETGSTIYDGSGTLDVRLEADIRGTTIYVSVDNVLAGLLYPGALIVPVYPIPDQIFRFGVFWPIDG